MWDTGVLAEFAQPVRPERLRRRMLRGVQDQAPGRLECFVVTVRLDVVGAARLDLVRAAQFDLVGAAQFDLVPARFAVFAGRDARQFSWRRPERPLRFDEARAQ
jgi:hypothetical protein